MDGSDRCMNAYQYRQCFPDTSCSSVLHRALHHLPSNSLQLPLPCRHGNDWVAIATTMGTNRTSMRVAAYWRAMLRRRHNLNR